MFRTDLITQYVSPQAVEDWFRFARMIPLQLFLATRIGMVTLDLALAGRRFASMSVVTCVGLKGVEVL